MLLAALATLAIAAALAAAACGSGDAPDSPTNPLEDTSTPAPSTPTRTATATATPTRTPSPSPTATVNDGGIPAPPSNAELESAIGAAIEVMAEWLAIEPTDLTLDEAEALVWPDSCIGSARWGQACDDVLTPGFRVRLLDRSGTPHSVHADTRGAFVWAGEVQAVATLSELDIDAGRALVEFDDGPAELVIVPGTLIEVPVPSAGETPAVVVSVDPPAVDGEPTLLAWIAPFVAP